MNKEQIEAERVKFEAHVRSECDNKEYADSVLEKTVNGFYPVTRIQGQWEGWQAAIAASAPQQALSDEHQAFIDGLDGEDKMFEQIERWAHESYRRHKSSVRGQQITHADGEKAHYIWAALRWAKENPEVSAQPFNMQLVEALQNMLEAWENDSKKPGWVRRWESAQAQGRAALAAAGIPNKSIG